MVAVQVLLFARARQLCGTDSVALTLAAPVTVAEAKRAMASSYPALAPLLGNLMVAVNERYAEDTQTLEDGDRVALIPPVSGG